jgi:hypothetical protein
MGDRSVTSNGPATLTLAQSADTALTMLLFCLFPFSLLFRPRFKSLELTVTVIISEQQKNEGRYRNHRYIRAQSPQHSQYFLPLPIQLPCLSMSRNTAHVNNCTMKL